EYVFPHGGWAVVLWASRLYVHWGAYRRGADALCRRVVPTRPPPGRDRDRLRRLPCRYTGTAFARLAPGAHDLCLWAGGGGLFPQFQADWRCRRDQGHLSLYGSVVRVRLPGARGDLPGTPAPLAYGPGL